MGLPVKNEGLQLYVANRWRSHQLAAALGSRLVLQPAGLNPSGPSQRDDPLVQHAHEDLHGDANSRESTLRLLPLRTEG